MKTIDLKEQATAVALTRKEKLVRWAELVRKQPTGLMIFHHLEHWNAGQLRTSMSELTANPNAFTLAFGDDVFRAAGLKGDSACDAMDFFELSQNELHAFSCDCGGSISTKQMAERIGHLAGGGRSSPSLLSRIGF